MRRSEYGPLQWSLASPAPGVAEKFRRRNTLLIAVLVFLVLGAFVAAEAPRTANTNTASQQSATPSLVHHANATKTAQPELHDRGPQYLNKNGNAGHHAG